VARAKRALIGAPRIASRVRGAVEMREQPSQPADIHYQRGLTRGPRGSPPLSLPLSPSASATHRPVPASIGLTRCQMSSVPTSHAPQVEEAAQHQHREGVRLAILLCLARRLTPCSFPPLHRHFFNFLRWPGRVPAQARSVLAAERVERGRPAHSAGWFGS